MELVRSAATIAGLAAFAAAGFFGGDSPGPGGGGRIAGPPIGRRGGGFGGLGAARRGRALGGRRGSAARAPRGRRGARPVRGRGDDLASARWARQRDLGPLVVTSGQGGPPPGRLVLGRVGKRLVAAERSQSVIVFGPTQSRKTTGFAVPAILGWEGPVVATSVKTDLVGDTIAHRRRCGTVMCFDPSGVTGLPSASWSPLPASLTWPGARRSAASLTDVAKGSTGTMADGDFWYATATKMLAPLLFAAACAGLGMADVVRWVDTQEETEVLAILEAAGVVEAVHAALSAFAKEDRQRSSIYTTVETILEPFGSELGAAGTGAPSIDPARLVSGPHTLYLCAPAHDQRRLSPLFTAVVRQIVEHVYEDVARTGRALDPPLLVVLDEAANIAPLSDLDGLASTAAGHGIQLVTVWHDLAQINARYGPRAATVVNNHRAKVFLSGISDPATLDHASHLIGDEEVLLPATTSGGQTGPTTTRSPSTRRLVPPDSLRRIPPGDGVLVYGGLPPARIRLRTWFDDPVLAARAAGRPGADPGTIDRQ